MTAIRDLLPAYAVGALDEGEAEMVERAIAADPDLAAELDALCEATADLALLSAPLAPSLGLRDRLLVSIRTERFARFVDRFTELFDVAAERARELLGLIDRPDAWEAGPTSTCWLLHFAGGPRVATVDTGFVRLARGERFAWHRHLGDEHALVLQGVLEDAQHGVFLPGDECQLAGGTEHDFVAGGTDDLIFAVVVGGVDFSVPR